MAAARESNHPFVSRVFVRRIITIAAVWVTLQHVGEIAGCLQYAFTGATGSAYAQELDKEVEGKARVWLGNPKRSGEKELIVDLEFRSVDESIATQLRVEIFVPEGPWRFRRATAPKGSALKLAVRQRRVANTTAGSKQRQTVLLLTATAKGEKIPDGTIAVLALALDRAELPAVIPLAINRFETESIEARARQQSPMLDPPPIDPPKNPAPTCFFFTH
jgi:hypothetical protein